MELPWCSDRETVRPGTKTAWLDEVVLMGLFSHLLSFCAGVYGGAYLAQNYEIGNVPSMSELAKRLESYIQEYKKPER
ncbi:hypothetical protein TELCIR_20002 [Teladorsagia circumcincta]|uniref:Uncharacterized protein n=1 Tax=Teladorsagia circumcincta TaxID=45464 RepID=A0A2G9TKQ2_TELCI|nr:hypothetical protein TELCIR_20002 [Teladorsagia circumcincta]